MSSSALSHQLNVSEDTIRRDLTELADKGEILKVHGGALSRSYHYSTQRSMVYAQEEKKQIARKAMMLIKPGMTVLIEAGTTMLELVKILPRKLEATFFTVSPLMALNLAEFPGITVVLLGGELDLTAQITLGARPVSELATLRVDLCILGANALDAERGLTENDWRVAQVKKAMADACRKLAVMTISEKLGSCLSMQVCGPAAIDYLFTELDPADARLCAYRENMTVG